MLFLCSLIKLLIEPQGIEIFHAMLTLSLLLLLIEPQGIEILL